MKKLALILVFLFVASVAQAESVQLTLTKSVSPNILRYVFYRSLTEASGYAAIDSIAATDTLYADLNVVAGTRYYYKAIAVATDLQRSVMSLSVSAQYLRTTDPQAIRISGVVKTAPTNYTVTWVCTTAMTGILQYKREGAAVWTDTPKDNASLTTHTYALPGLVEPARYFLRVGGYVGTVMTVSVQFTLDTAAAPLPPTIKKIVPF